MKKNGYQDFIELCYSTTSKEMLTKLFNFILTPEEQENLGTRILLIRELLAAKESQRDIAKNLRISIAKITRGSNNLKLLDQKTKKYLLQSLLGKDESISNWR